MSKKIGQKDWIRPHARKTFPRHHYRLTFLALLSLSEYWFSLFGRLPVIPGFWHPHTCAEMWSKVCKLRTSIIVWITVLVAPDPDSSQTAFSDAGMHSPLPWRGHSTWTAAAAPVKPGQRAPCTPHPTSGCPGLSQWPPGRHHSMSGLQSATCCRDFTQSTDSSLKSHLKWIPDLMTKLELSKAYTVPQEKARRFLHRQANYFLPKNESDLSPQSK